MSYEDDKNSSETGEWVERDEEESIKKNTQQSTDALAPNSDISQSSKMQNILESESIEKDIERMSIQKIDSLVQ